MKLDILFHYEVNEQTGEIKYIGKEEIKVDTTKIVRAGSKTEDNDLEPKLYLEDVRYRLNAKAVALLNVQPGDKLEIGYNKYPIISKTEHGNQVTQKFTVRFGGNKNAELSKYGNEFVIKEDNGRYILDSGKELPELPKGDEKVNTDNLDEINLDEFLDSSEDKKEIKADFFKL